MKRVIETDISNLIPYERNARTHDEDQIKKIARSIQEFGFVNPVLIDGSGMIIAGHGRVMAAKRLGMAKVPCLCVDGMTDDQKRAYIIADNQLALDAGWDMELLKIELQELNDLDFDITLTGFGMDMIEVEEPDQDDGYYGDERENTYKAYNLYDFDLERTAGFYQMPMIHKVNYIPDDLIGFNYMLTSEKYEKGIHFYVDDYQFERIWNKPQIYIEKMEQFDCCLTPDFSLYFDMPMAMKIWNVYRSRLIGQMCQDAGMTVIPTLSWAEKETFSFCFDGLEPGGTVSVSTIGVKRDEGAMKIWTDGMDEAMKRLKPKTVLVYGGDIGYDFGKTKAVYYKNAVIDRWKNG